MPSSPQRVLLGVIAGVHGVRGEVKIRSFTDDPFDLTEYGPLQDTQGRTVSLTVRAEAKGQLIASVDGITDRNAAELLKGTELYVPRSALPEAEEGVYYIADLVGMKVMEANGTLFGEVVSMQNFSAGNLVEIAHNGRTEFYPFTLDVFPKTDIKARVMTITLPEIIESDDEERE